MNLHLVYSWFACSEIYHTDAEWGLHSALKQHVCKQAVRPVDYNPLILTFDPNFQRDILLPRQFQVDCRDLLVWESRGSCGKARQNGSTNGLGRWVYIYIYTYILYMYIYIDTFYMPFGKELMPTAVREKHGKKNMI